jgi:tRNA C32,U32 (ribose-2'-O)-methylase TrmJ
MLSMDFSQLDLVRRKQIRHGESFRVALLPRQCIAHRAVRETYTTRLVGVELGLATSFSAAADPNTLEMMN